MPDETLREHIWVTGRVKGVGFRAFVVASAGYIGVVGWVRNVGLNTVEAVAQGTRLQIDQFIQAVKTGPRASRVDEHRVDYETPANDLIDFEFRSSR